MAATAPSRYFAGSVYIRLGEMTALTGATLGAPEDIYKEYSRAIRKEYS
jgi:hypothetical protein